MMNACSPGFARLLLIAILLCSLPAAAHADSKPKKLPEVAAAMQKAQSLYLQQNDQSFSKTKTQRIPSADFLAFYNGLQALGRYQFVATPGQADLVLRYEAAGAARTIWVIDPKDLLSFGSFWNQGGLANNVANVQKAERELLQQAVVLIGTSKAATPVQPLPPPVLYPTTIDAPAKLRSATHVLLLDDGTARDFPPKKRPYGRGQMAAQFKSEIAAWGHDQVVDSLADADIVLQLGGYIESYHETNVNAHGHSHTVDIDNPQLELNILDAKTLEPLANLSVTPVTSTRKSKPDPRLATIQRLFDQFTGLVNFPPA